MKRILLTLLCLFIVSICAWSTFASSAGDVAIAEGPMLLIDNNILVYDHIDQDYDLVPVVYSLMLNDTIDSGSAHDGDVKADNDSIPTSDNGHFFVSAGNGTYDFNMTQYIYPDDVDEDSIPTSDNGHFFVSAGNGTYDFNMTQYIYPDDVDESGASQITQDNGAIDNPSTLDDSIVTVQT